MDLNWGESSNFKCWTAGKASDECLLVVKWKIALNSLRATKVKGSYYFFKLGKKKKFNMTKYWFWVVYSLIKFLKDYFLGLVIGAHVLESELVLNVKVIPNYLDWEAPLEEGMATHSSILAWRIPWTEEPGRLQSLGSHRVGHNWSDLAQHSTAFLSFLSLSLLIFKWKTIFDIILGHLGEIEAMCILTQCL